MEMFEDVAVLTSIIIGLGLAHLLQGVARRPRRIRRVRGLLLLEAGLVLRALRLYQTVA